VKYVDTAAYVAGCPETACEAADIDAVAYAAAEADAIVIVVGLALEQEREAFDRTDLLLPAKQKDLITAVADSAAGRPVVLVVMTGGNLDITFARDDPRIGAILWVGYPGQAGGDALAQILFGETNPSKYNIL
jgi:beta-D-xylosidase 4